MGREGRGKERELRHNCQGIDTHAQVHECSGVGTNLKVGTHVRRERPKNNFYRAPPLFGSESTISRFGERFRDRHCSLVSSVFAVLFTGLRPVSSLL